MLGRFTFRPLVPADLAMVEEWLARPHVAEWWQGPIELDDDVQAFIAILDDQPAGYIQVYTTNDPSRRGIDQFLCHAGDLGRGLGTAMVRAFVERIFADPAVTSVQLDPHVRNARAIRCYQKAGFVAEGEVATGDGPALLMTLRR